MPIDWSFLSFNFKFVPRREIEERLEGEEYSSVEKLEFHLRYEAEAPPTPPGGLVEKAAFLSEIAEKAISLLAEREVQGRSNLMCARVVVKAKKALADLRACADGEGGILPHASRLRDGFEDLKSRCAEVVGEVQRERRELHVFRWNRRLYAATVVCVLLPQDLDLMFPPPRALIGTPEFGVTNYLGLMFRVLPFLGGIWWSNFNDGGKDHKKVTDELKITARWLEQVAALFFRVLDEEIVPVATASDSDEATSSDAPVAGADPPAGDEMV